MRRWENRRLAMMGITGGDEILEMVKRSAAEACEGYDNALRELLDFTERIGLCDCASFAVYMS